LSIKMHHFLRIVLSSIFFIIGMIVFAVLMFNDMAIVGFIIGIIGFITSGYLGHKFTHSVPAACPQCNGNAYGKKSPEGRFYFECSECGHIQKTGFVDSNETTE